MTSLEKVDQLESDLLATTEELRKCRDLLTRIYGWDHMDTAADAPYWREEMRKLGIKHPDPARA